jgi:hypothetical protein
MKIRKLLFPALILLAVVAIPQQANANWFHKHKKAKASDQLKAAAAPHSNNLSWVQSVIPAGATCPAGSTATSTAVTSNSVYRSTTSGGEAGTTPISVSAAAETTYSDTTVAPGNVFYYTVTATNCGGTSPMSNEVGPLTTPNPLPPNAPTGLTGTAQ